MDGLLLEIPIAENDKEILENLLTKPETSSPPLESLSETAAKVLFELAINKVRSRKIKSKHISSHKYLHKILNRGPYL